MKKTKKREIEKKLRHMAGRLLEAAVFDSGFLVELSDTDNPERDDFNCVAREVIDRLLGGLK